MFCPQVQVLCDGTDLAGISSQHFARKTTRLEFAEMAAMLLFKTSAWPQISKSSSCAIQLCVKSRRAED